MNLFWYVLRSKTNKELALWRELTTRGFDSYYPQLHVKPVNPRSRKVLPYFPGYLFVHTDMEEVGTSAFQWMPFSSGCVSFGGTFATVPDNLIEAIRRHVDEINAAGGRWLAGLKRGETVIIQDGPFAGYEAIFDAHLPGQERVRVLLKLLQTRQIGLVLPESQIRKAESRKKKG